MASRRDRVMAALDFKATDRVPKDLGGMRSTGISAFAYPGLRAALGLPYRAPKMYDTGQMLALPDIDVLDALGCDVVHVTLDECTNAFDEPEKWTTYDYNGRLPALVMNKAAYRAEPDGTIVQDMGGRPARMVPASYVFDTEHAGEVLDLAAEIVEPDLPAIERSLASQRFTEERARSIGAYCRHVRERTDRAIFFNGLQVDLGFPGGMAAWSMVCLLHPDWVRAVHELKVAHARALIAALAPELKGSVDIVMFSADDQGTQNGPILPPELFAGLYAPYYRQMTDALHAALPGGEGLPPLLRRRVRYPGLDHRRGFRHPGPGAMVGGEAGLPCMERKVRHAHGALGWRREHAAHAPAGHRGRRPARGGRGASRHGPRRRLRVLRHPQHPRGDRARQGGGNVQCRLQGRLRGWIVSSTCTGRWPSSPAPAGESAWCSPAALRRPARALC